MDDTIAGQPVQWAPAEDWEARARRMVAMLRQRQGRIRGVAVTGDYASGDWFGASQLILLVFRAEARPDYTLGNLQAREGMPVVLDWVTTAFLVDVEPLLHDDLRAHRLASLRWLAQPERTLASVMLDFRDCYFRWDERAARIQRLLDGAGAHLRAAEHGGVAGEAVAAVIQGYGPALSHTVDESPSRRRGLLRLREAARVRRAPVAVVGTLAGLQLSQRDPRALLASMVQLRAVLEAHIQARHAEAIGGLLPQLAGETAKASVALEALLAQDDAEAASLAILACAWTIDAAVAREAPDLRATPAYAEAAHAVYGDPDTAALRLALAAVRRSASLAEEQDAATAGG